MLCFMLLHHQCYFTAHETTPLGLGFVLVNYGKPSFVPEYLMHNWNGNNKQDKSLRIEAQ